MPILISQRFLLFHLLTEKLNSMYPHWPVKSVHLRLILGRIYTGNVNMSSTPNVSCWRDPDNSYSRDKTHFYIPWSE
jgi:hypothetical protein